MRRAAGLLITLTFGCALGLAPASAPGEPDDTFAAILKLEDRRTTGGGSLLEYLDASRPMAVRMRGTLAVGRIGAPVTTPYDLIAPLRDPAPELRRMAVFALGEMDDVKAAPLLASALLDPDRETRGLAAEALGKLADPASVPALMARLDDDDPDVAGMTLLALWKVDAGEMLAQQVQKAAAIHAAASGDLRWRAAYFLMRSSMGHPGDERLETALMPLAGDTDPLIRSFCARGLGAVKSARATEALLGLAGDADWRVRVNAFNALKTRPVELAGSAGGRWKLYEKALSDADAGVALAALAALESCKAAEAGKALLAALRDGKPRWREVAAIALAARDGASSLPAIRPLAADPVWSVRARTAEALASIDPAPDEDLGRLAADADPRVRAVAIESLGKLKTSRQDRVTAALDDPDLFVRAAALAALVPLVTKEPPPAQDAGRLVEILSAGYRRALADPQNDARLAALETLARLGTQAARGEVERALEDADYLVRRRAALLLRDSFHLDRFSKVGEARTTRSDADYREAVTRSRRRVTATIDTDRGTIEIELFPQDAPLTVDNFIRLARDGRFDGLAFHRVVPNFVIQDGDPRGDGNGGPPWQIRCEINRHRYGTGAVGMALSGKDTGGSQYFITHSPQPHLDGGYTIFGQVTKGQDVVDRMVQGDGVRRIRIAETPGAS